MATISFPKTAQEFLDAMQNAMNKAMTFPDKKTMAFSEATYLRLADFLPNYQRELSEAQSALVAQMNSTLAKEHGFDRTAMFISHYFQTFNNAIARGLFPATHRQFYYIDANDTKVPVINSATELQSWAAKVKEGDAKHILAGGRPITMPSAAEVEAEYQIFVGHRQAQTGLKDAYDKEQQDIKSLYGQVRLLVRDIWDEVEFYFRHETHESLRRRAREYGLVYLDDFVNPETGEPVKPLTGKVAPLTSVVVIEGSFDPNTLFIVTNKGLVPIKFYSAAKAGDAVPSSAIEVAPGAQKEIWASELGAEANTLLMVYNASETTEGAYEVLVGE
jgi:hypothetical protein